MSFSYLTAILLAAGSSRRFGSNKLTADYHGQTVFSRALAALTDSVAIQEILVVVNPCFDLPVNHAKCRVVVNANHEKGMGSSLIAGILAASSTTDAYLLSLADMPRVTTALVNDLIGFFRASNSQIAIPRHRGRKGHPVIFNASLKDELLLAAGDAGARQVVANHPDCVGYFDTADAGVLFDVDTVEDLTRSPEK